MSCFIHNINMLFNKKCGIGIVAVLVLCIIVGTLLALLLPTDDNETSGILAELPETSKWYGNEEIRLFRQYLTFPTMPPDIDYKPTVEFLKQQALTLELPVSVYYPVNQDNPVVVITWTGSDPSLESIMLNSHTDVVPVFEELWTHPPFAAEVDEDGRIFGRGAQDTKSIGMLYLAAIKALRKDGIQQLRRTFHITFVPDEEMGGYYGLGSFVQTAAFRALNVGYALDEGSVSPTNEITVINDERCTWRVKFTCHGVTGHGSILFENTTGEKMNTLIRGVQGNVIPPELSVTFDVRLAVTADHEAFQRDIDQWIEDAGGNITVDFLIRDPKANKTNVDETNPMWLALQNTARELNLDIIPGVMSGATDMLYMRALNVPAFGFSPLINTPNLAHDHNEFLQADCIWLA